MFTLATSTQMKELDRVAIEEHGIPSLELMNNLGLLIKAAALRTSFTKRLMLPAIAS